jgi:hypothetical protein
MNVTLNGRIDEVNRALNGRIDDMNSRMDDMNRMLQQILQLLGNPLLVQPVPAAASSPARSRRNAVGKSNKQPPNQ